MPEDPAVRYAVGIVAFYLGLLVVWFLCLSDED